MEDRTRARAAAQNAISAIGRGYDITSDLRLSYCKAEGPLIELGEDLTQDVVVPGGITIPNASKAIKCDKGERMRFRSDVLPFQQMSEQFNQELNVPGKIPSGVFNAMYEFTGSWQKDASGTKSLAFDGWFITLYSVELTRSHVVLRDAIKEEVPSSWDPAALAGFIDKYGTHIIVGVKMGGKDVIYVKQQHTSSLQSTEVQKLLKMIADERFSISDGRPSLDSEETSRKDKVSESLIRMNHLMFVNSNSSTSHPSKEDITKVFKRRGGIDTGQGHHQWLASVPLAPDVICMSFVPITSLLNGVPGSGFLSHAVNLYLRYKPPIEELCQFLEFQLPRQWAPVFGELPLGPQRKEHGNASLQFSLMGPKLYVNTNPVNVGKKPVTGVRLYLEGKKNNRLAIHLQHLSTLPKILQLLEDDEGDADEFNHHKYYEPVQWKSFSHVCTAPVECSGTIIGDPASIVTGAQLEVRSEKMKKVLFLKLRFSRVLGASIRRSQWDNSPSTYQKSGIISTLISTHFTSAQQPPKPAPFVINSAVYPGGPPVPVQAPKLLKFVDTTELTKGPQDMPGHWVLTGAKLCVERGKISLRVKYSLLTISSDMST